MARDRREAMKATESESQQLQPMTPVAASSIGTQSRPGKSLLEGEEERREKRAAPKQGGKTESKGGGVQAQRPEMKRRSFTVLSRSLPQLFASKEDSEAAAHSPTVRGSAADLHPTKSAVLIP